MNGDITVWLTDNDTQQITMHLARMVGMDRWQDRQTEAQHIVTLLNNKRAVTDTDPTPPEGVPRGW